MGQAKARGMREQRAQQAVERDAAMCVERKRREIEAKAKEAERVAAMPPAEQKRYRERKHQKNMSLATLAGIAMALQMRGRNA